MLIYLVFFFFFKQKTAYEMRISDWSSDVCSSDLSRSGDRQRVSISRIPATHRGQDWQEVLSRRGKPMRETGRSLAILIALKQSSAGEGHEPLCQDIGRDREVLPEIVEARDAGAGVEQEDRKSTRLNSSH